MKNSIYKIIMFCFEMIFSLILLIASIMFMVASIHNIKMLEDIKTFIEEAEFEFQSGNTFFFSIETDEIDENTITVEKLNANLYGPPTLGAPGDIFVMPQSRMEYIPLSSQFISYLFGGHAGIVLKNNRLIEAMGGTKEQGYIYNFPTDLFIEDRTVIGLRVDASIEERRQAALNAETLVGRRYNYWYIFNTKNAYYCTDLCARVYGKEFGLKYQIDTNGFHTSVQDLFRSKNTKITFVKYVDNGKTYIYYLKNSNLGN